MYKRQSVYNYLSWFIIPLINAKYARQFQKEADIEAAKTMADKQGFVNVLTNMKNHTEDGESKFALKRLINNIINPLKALLRFKPSFDTRIEYISNVK